MVMVPDPPSPPGGWPTKRKWFHLATLKPADVVGLGVLGTMLAVTDAVFLALGRNSKDVGLFALWVGIQVFICILGGIFQGIRRRSWSETVIVGVGAAMLLALIVLIMAVRKSGAADCNGQGPCDTSFGFGAVLIAIITAPLFTGVVAIGRALSGLRKRFGRL